MDPEQEKLADYPSVVREFIEYSRSQGVVFTQDTLDQLHGGGNPNRDLGAQAGGSSGQKCVSWGKLPSQGSGNSSGSGLGQGSGEPIEGSEGEAPIPDGVELLANAKEELSSDSIRAVMRAIFELCPDAVPLTSSSTLPRACDFEGMFGKSKRTFKSSLHPTLYHRVTEVLEEVRGRFVNAALGEKAPSTALPPR